MEVINVYKNYIDRKCDKRGFIKQDSLTEQQREGAKTLTARSKNKEIVMTTTDKSNKTSVMPPETFEIAMEKHVSGDKEIDVKEGNKIAGSLGKHSKSYVKIIGIGKNHGQKDHKRAIANATVHKDGEIPILRGSDKDHKSEIEMRPICNGMVGPKKPLSEMVSETLETILEVDGVKICKSTEDMIYSFETYNKSSENT